MADSPKSDRRKRFFSAFLMVVFSLLVWMAYQIYIFWEYGIDDAYMKMDVARIIIDYMEENQGRWPRSWDDLRPCYERSKTPTSEEEFQRLQRRFGIDFSADPKELAEAEPPALGPPFEVVWAKKSSGTHFEGHEPNWMIYNYLKQPEEE